MRNIMKRAWEIFRTLTGDRLAKLSQALKMAWAEAKSVVLSGKERCIARLNEILANSCTYDYCELYVSAKDWQTTVRTEHILKSLKNQLTGKLASIVLKEITAIMIILLMFMYLANQI